MKQSKTSAAGSKLSRHEHGCRVCTHPHREEIEREFIGWKSPAAIAREYGLRDRASIYRHSHAAGLFSKRSRNLRGALERIIERVSEVEVSASAVVAAIQAFAKINAAGQWIDRSEQVNLNDLFDRMSLEELEVYAKDGILPHWFSRTLGATLPNGSGGGENG
jgi:hypothetical protein